ncbi:MAG TPA: hypothetical protein VKD70_13180 [Candidatus Acidoferrum sp.]|nr:hypothetical protein [Candidatus Acidoferrum sp.]
MGTQTPRKLPDRLRNVMPIVRHRPLITISGFTNLTVAWVAELSSLIMIFYWFLIRPYPQYGLPVDFKAAAAAATSPWPETLSVYIDGRARFLVNGQFGKRSSWHKSLKKSSEAEWFGRFMLKRIRIQVFLKPCMP